MDRPWWDRYFQDVKNKFKGARFTLAKAYDGVELARIDIYQNSGAGAMALAAKLGAKNIVMLGYDCKHTDGKKHWHGDHPKGLGNAGKVKSWPAQFEYLARKLARLKVVNCSRTTALKSFPLMDLEQALHECN